MKIICATSVAILTLATVAGAENFYLLTGVDHQKYPGARRMVDAVPGPGIANAFDDGDRLAGTNDTGGTVAFVGIGVPVYPPNHVGAFSFLFRRGSVPAFGLYVPLMGIDYLGGPLLDLDGDIDNTARSLVPVTGQSHVEIPDSSSFIELGIDTAGGVITLLNFDATGTSEGAPGFDGRIAVTVVTLAGTEPDGTLGDAINPSIDTRVGTLTPFTGNGNLTGVWRVENLGFELWYDSISPETGTPNDLGTMQHLGTFRGWYVVRNCETGEFPLLSGQGLGTTLWPQVDTSQVGNTFNAAVTVFGPTATIFKGASQDGFFTGDDFTVAGNGGVALTDAGGDIGAYFDSVVVPHLDPQARAFVYLEAAGFGINNSGDPVFTDTIGYDVVVIAQSLAAAVIVGDVNGDGVINPADADALVEALLDPGALSACEFVRADVNQDESVDALDIQALVTVLLQ